MQKNFDLTIVTPERVTYQGKARSLSLPAWEGSMGILPGHQAALVLLREGVVNLGLESGEDALSVSGGFAEIGPKQVTLFAETAELAQNLDEERAKLAAQRAKDTLVKARQGKPGAQEADVEAAQAALRRALVRLKVAGALRRIRRPGAEALPRAQDRGN
jgi:F-type H+-transporting ATPase subunit epsilon